jgi:hypothetical protein
MEENAIEVSRHYTEKNGNTPFPYHVLMPLPNL